MFRTVNKEEYTYMMSAESTESSDILLRAKMEGEVPNSWAVFPLRRNKVKLGIVGWIVGMIVGAGLFAAFATVAIPTDFRTTFGTIFSLFLLGVLAFTALGSAWSIIYDILRLRDADRHIIVITPEDFVKQEGKKVTHVPLFYVQHVTARGNPPPDRTARAAQEDSHVPSLADGITGLFVGRRFTPSGQRGVRKRKRTPTTLAFIDARTESEVIVVTDAAYGDPFLIAAHLRQYAASAQNL
jgi:hypothetical protein